jgi:ABC-type multidrug transport system ATPase subunit
MSAVEVDGVWKFYGDYPALKNIRLEAEPGACLALIGRNGAGKTTLLRIIAGFNRPGKGQVRIFGKEPRETETRSSIGFIGHGISVYDELSAL